MRNAHMIRGDQYPWRTNAEAATGHSPRVDASGTFSATHKGGKVMRWLLCLCLLTQASGVSNFGKPCDAKSLCTCTGIAHGNTMEDITLVSANITSWKKRNQMVFDLKPTIAALQETRISEAVKQGVYRRAATMGYTATIGKSCNMSKRNKTQKNTPFNCKQGGVMIISEDAACKGTISARTHSKEAMSLYEQTRFVRCAVPLVIDSKICFLHLSSLHNLLEYTALAKQAKERNHADIW